MLCFLFFLKIYQNVYLVISKLRGTITSFKTEKSLDHLESFVVFSIRISRFYFIHQYTPSGATTYRFIVKKIYTNNLIHFHTYMVLKYLPTGCALQCVSMWNIIFHLHVPIQTPARMNLICKRLSTIYLYHIFINKLRGRNKMVHKINHFKYKVRTILCR